MTSETKIIGKVIFFSNKKGYGFLSWEKDGVKQKDMFAHYSDIINQDGFKSLYKDQDVRFDVGVNAHGDPKAINIELVK
jgi:cold shock CspA family protein